MDNLKKNLHFVVFGVGILLGVVFLLVGIMIRGGTEEELSTAQINLAKWTVVPTKGTLDQATERSNRFGDSLKDAETKLTSGPGVAFTSGFTTYGSGSEFYTSEARPSLQKLKDRFAAMAKPVPMPSLMEGWALVRSGSDKEQIWDRLEGEMTSPAPDKIREMQMRLRILQELAATCERLLASGAGETFGVKLLEVNFDSFGVTGGGEADSPWLSMPFTVKLECSPSFAVVLADELVNPTTRTMSGQGENARRGFPILLDMLQTEMTERPPEIRLDVGNEDKAEVARKLNEKGKGIIVPPDPTELDPEIGEGKKLVEAATEDLNENDRIVLPVRAGLKLRAAAFNKNWRAVKKEENQ